MDKVQPTVSPAQNKKTIILIEDDPLLVKMYSAKLTSEGYQVLVAEDGEVGLKLVLEDKGDLVLLDIAWRCSTSHRRCSSGNWTGPMGTWHRCPFDVGNLPQGWLQDHFLLKRYTCSTLSLCHPDSVWSGIDHLPDQVLDTVKIHYGL